MKIFKFIYSEKAIKFEEISLRGIFHQILAAFSENLNFIKASLKIFIPVVQGSHWFFVCFFLYYDLTELTREYIFFANVDCLGTQNT